MVWNKEEENKISALWYLNGKEDNYVLVSSETSNGYAIVGWRVSINTWQTFDIIKHLKTKNKAMTIANKWMKEHQNG